MIIMRMYCESILIMNFLFLIFLGNKGEIDAFKNVSICIIYYPLKKFFEEFDVANFIFPKIMWLRIDWKAYTSCLVFYHTLMSLWVTIKTFLNLKRSRINKIKYTWNVVCVRCRESYFNITLMFFVWILILLCSTNIYVLTEKLKKFKKY